MSNLTRYGVAYNLQESPYRYNVVYDSCCTDITFVFSSALYRNNFIKRFKENRKTINRSLSKRFGFAVENDVLCDIKLYSGIEKRGFLIYNDGKGFEWLDKLLLDGGSLTEKN